MLTAELGIPANDSRETLKELTSARCLFRNLGIQVNIYWNSERGMLGIRSPVRLD